MAATRLWRTRRPWARIYPVPKRSGFRCAKHRVECFRMTQPKSRSIPSYTLGRWPILPKAFSSSKRCGVHQKKSKQISPSDASGRSNSKSIRAYLLTVFYRLSWLHSLLNPCCSSAYHCSTGSSIRASIKYSTAFVKRGECWPLAGKLVSLKNVSFAAAFGAMFFAKCFEFRMFVMEARIAE